jgi:hypothetical protein
MKKRNFRYDEGGEVTYGEDERPAATGMSEAAELMPEKPKDKPKAKTKPPGGTPGGAMRGQRAESPSPQRIEVTAKRAPKDDETKSVSERAKAARERARMGGTSTDDRSVTERMGGSERKGSSTSTDTRSLADRMKAMRESARSSSTGTDTRSVGERIRSTLGFAKGGSVKGGSVKGGGCEQRGLRKCKVM